MFDHAVLRSKAKGLFPSVAECLRRASWKPLMHWKSAGSASRRVAQDRRQTSTVFRVLKKVSTASSSWQFPSPLIETGNL